MDLRGHGRTAERTGSGRVGAPGVEGFLEDVRALHLVTTEQHPGVPRLLLGHSMGSGVALADAEEDGGDLAVLARSGALGVNPDRVDSVSSLEAAVAAGLGDQPLD